MKIIGLTGNIAMGKSAASRFLAQMGARVEDADAIAREVTAEGGAALTGIRERFGDGVFDDGVLNRRRLAEIVFANGALLEKLNKIVHPLVYDVMLSRINEATAAGEDAIILDVPLLYESGWDARCDEVWLVFTDGDVQQRRLMERDGFSQEEALARIAAQQPMSEKLKRADRIIDNNGTPESLRAQLESLWQGIKDGRRDG